MVCGAVVVIGVVAGGIGARVELSVEGAGVVMLGCVMVSVPGMMVVFTSGSGIFVVTLGIVSAFILICKSGNAMSKRIAMQSEACSSLFFDLFCNFILFWLR